MVPTSLNATKVNLITEEDQDDEIIAQHAADPDPDGDESPWSWMWNGALVMADGSMKGATERVVTEKAVKVTVPGHLTRVVDAEIVFAKGCLTDDDSQYLNSKGTSWSLQDGLLGMLSTELWEAILAADIPLQTLPTVDSSANFPYHYDKDTLGLVCVPGTLRLETDYGQDKNLNRPCHFCGKLISGRLIIGVVILANTSYTN
ncbi:hypothetical protein EWM64_g8799 [Hericium alpestre]|uniref:Uncharacterized protein n=1 Tax=Hericium alpestre TaxID=135208 RepID=A0A4Y9ZML3_9AGAM|nr:hypothetical protein EWM64_g8799 [Hericium alpestre]